MKQDFSNLDSILNDKLLDILEPIAVKGLKAFKKILDDSGFADSKYLKDYEIYSEMTRHSVNFHLVINLDSVEEESIRKMRKESEHIYSNNARQVKNRDEAREFLRIYMMKPDGRPQRILGSRNAVIKQKNITKYQRDARKTAYDRENDRNPRNSGERLVSKEFAISSPRSIEVLTEGKLRLTVQREIRNTNRKVIFPKGTYQGIVKKLLEDVSKIIESSFVEELNRIIKTVYR